MSGSSTEYKDAPEEGGPLLNSNNNNAKESENSLQQMSESGRPQMSLSSDEVNYLVFRYVLYTAQLLRRDVTKSLS